MLPVDVEVPGDLTTHAGEMNMTRFLLVTAAACMVAGSAAAADLPVRPVAAPVVASWQGFYFGVHGGWARSEADVNDPLLANEALQSDVARCRPSVTLFTTTTCPGTVAPFGKFKSDGFVFGGHAGYNWQFGAWVLGLETDFTWADLEASKARSVQGTNRVSVQPGDPGTDIRRFDERLTFDTEYFGTVRARGGWAFGNFLGYVTGGLAWAHTKAEFGSVLSFQCSGNFFFSCSPPVSGRATLSAASAAIHFGWVAGAGIEAMVFGPNLIVGVEYLHYDFGSASHTFGGTGFGSTFPIIGTTRLLAVNTPIDLTADVVRARVSWKFN
jgi:outer membrane immunogenic protein